MRVASWNLWWRFGDWKRRQSAIVDTLRRLRPDVIALQEVWATGHRTQAGVLAAELGMHDAFAPATCGDRWAARGGHPAVDVGTAVLSRWPIAGFRSHPLPEAEMPATETLVEGPAGLLRIFNVHLHAQLGGSAVRVTQVRALSRLIARTAPSELPVVLCGDCNAEPDSDEIRLLEGHKTAPAVEGQVLVDAWRFARPEAAGATWARANPHVADLGYPDARVDYVFVGPPAARGLGRVLTAERFGDAPVDGVWPSDHFGIATTLALTPVER